MDPQVIPALERWPSVPAVWGWLRLDRRGDWWLVDRGRTDFDEARDGAGSRITHRRLIEFIGRNYTGDDEGRWFWQNGPQRVYVDLDAAPFVARTIGSEAVLRWVTHTGSPIASIEAGWLGPDGQLLLRTDRGGAVVHDLDLAALPLSEHGTRIELRLPGGPIVLGRTDSPERTLGFVARPREAPPAPAPRPAG